eukprot:CAMPEP_0176434714 /NCGR_PEP_ID=MMETSP0127-20121128/16853_1 /TAXON_ID=938130 /ORGANISM="Platyophrya macrostoma, Strain WH" /LENGTH=201 /DNA_ID=CAMNT_0017817527 /DNA_START=177 /DNA_END=782 /DNA_ORIENTATION=+
MDSSDTKSSLDCIEFRDDDFPYYDNIIDDFYPTKPQIELPKLFQASKKISKREKKVKAITRQNAEKLAPFFQKWKQMRKTDKCLKKQIKLWFSSYNEKLNKTYIYRDFFGTTRVHFRLAVREPSMINFQKLDEATWQTFFVNLTDYLMREVNKSMDIVSKGKKSQVYPVWIDGLNSFQIEKLPSTTASTYELSQFFEFLGQ